MRFKKGTKVEVSSKSSFPSCSWRCAEVMCGNGHAYTVRYEGPAGTISEAELARVSRKQIRPCPPLPETVKSWTAGDMVEVFLDFSWKPAIISGVLGTKYFLARIFGSSLEFKVSQFGIRTRQVWEDDRWIVIGKDSGICEDMRNCANSTLKKKFNSQTNIQMTKTRVGDVSFPMRNSEELLQSNIASCRTSKRGHDDYKRVEMYEGASQKCRAVEKEGRLHRLIAANQFSFDEQVDGVAFPKELVGEKFIHSALYNQTSFTEMDAERRKQTGAVGCSSEIDLESHDEDSVASSVGSCSITSRNFYKVHQNAGHINDSDDNCSDAESSCFREYKEWNIFYPTKEEVAAEIHRAELHAYRCTMAAFYASGPLSWEQEALVTNLRLFLHISNDEHLMEVRNLVSANNSIPSR